MKIVNKSYIFPFTQNSYFNSNIEGLKGVPDIVIVMLVAPDETLSIITPIA